MLNGFKGYGIETHPVSEWVLMGGSLLALVVMALLIAYVYCIAFPPSNGRDR